MADAQPTAITRRRAAIGCAAVALVGFCLSGFVAQYVYFHQDGLFPGDGAPPPPPPTHPGEGGGCEFPPFS